MFSKEIIDLAKEVLKLATDKKVMIVTAESCTGGLIIGALTENDGSSSAVNCGFITYSNEAKMKLLGVKKQTLKNFRAVSEQTATEMAEGALKAADIIDNLPNIAVSVTGVAGSGCSDDKPAGLVYFSVARFGEETKVKKEFFEGKNRQGVREATIKTALTLLKDEIKRL